MRIALDLDGVVYAWDKTARYMLRRKLTQERRPIPVELFSPSRHWDSIQECISPEDWDWLWTEGVNLGLFRYGHCITGSIEGVEELSHAGDLCIVTSRDLENPVILTDTTEWLDFMFDRSDYDELIHSNSKHEVDADIFIDDSPIHALKLHEAGKKVVVFQQPWNDQLPFSVGTQVNNWPAVVETVKGWLP